MINSNVRCDWIITYDAVTEIEEIYKNYKIYLYDLNYSASTKCTVSELIIFGNGIIPPTNEILEQANIKINLRADGVMK